MSPDLGIRGGGNRPSGMVVAAEDGEGGGAMAGCGREGRGASRSPATRHPAVAGEVEGVRRRPERWR